MLSAAQLLPTWYLIGAAVLFGLAVGSFLNVVICRLPQGKSVVSPASRCPRCETAIRWYDNVPLLGWLWLGGKCRNCKEPISIEYPLVEAANGALWGVLIWRFGLVPETPVYLALASALLALTLIDLHHQILPDRITLPGIVVGLAASAFLLPVGILPAVYGVVLGGGLFLVIAVVSRGGMGGGDIKLIAMIGAFLGWQAVLLTTVVAATTGSLVGLVLMALYGKGRKYAVPFGPFLSAGALVSLLWGTPLIDWYIGLSRP
ncbi:MAG: prepilin peptidase [Nitrospirota bacterium]|nr:prepilin peptidase [Nitrospirota bacterium]